MTAATHQFPHRGKEAGARASGPATTDRKDTLMAGHNIAQVAALMPAVGSAPPGTGNLQLIIGWVAFLMGAALLGGFMAAMGKSGLSALRHGQFEGGAAAVGCLVCGVFLTAAGAIFGALGITA